MRSLFPFTEIKKGSRIILYGASSQGYDFYRQLITSDYCRIIRWVDRQYEWYRYLGLPVDPPEILLKDDFDLIVLTCERSETTRSIERDLTSMGIDRERIFWKADSAIKGEIACRFDEARMLEESKDAYLVSPLQFLREDRMDFIVKYLYAREILERSAHTTYADMYRRLVLYDNGFDEPADGLISGFFSDYALKRGAYQFDHSFRELIEDIKANGFRKDRFLPLDRSKRLINGVHRMAAALAVGCDVWARDYPYDGVSLTFDKKWLDDAGFSDDEIQLITKEYVRLSSKRSGGEG